MDPYKLYIQQTSYDGVTYTKGNVVDTYTQWGIVCADSPYKRFGDPKEMSTRDWLDEHGLDVYIPASVKLKPFDAEFTFLCVGLEDDVKTKVRDFQRFLLGKGSEISGKTVAAVGARLIIYDSFNQIGWKDVRLKSFSSEALVMDNGDEEVKLRFKVIFEVDDPATEIRQSVSHGQVILVEDNWT